MTESMKEDHHEFLELIFFTPSEFEKAGGAWPIRIGRNIAKTNYHIGPRTTPYYYLLFVLEGEGTFIQNGQCHALRPRDAFCLFPHVTHEYWTDPEDTLQKIFIAFDGAHAAELLSRIGLTPDSPYRSGVLTPETASAMRSFMEDVRKPQDGASDLGRLTRFLTLFDRIARSPEPKDCNRIQLHLGSRKARNTWTFILQAASPWKVCPLMRVWIEPILPNSSAKPMVCPLCNISSN